MEKMHISQKIVQKIIYNKYLLIKPIIKNFMMVRVIKSLC